MTTNQKTGELTYSCCLANPKIRNTLREPLTNFKWKNPVAKNIATYMLSLESDFDLGAFKAWISEPANALSNDDRYKVIADIISFTALADSRVVEIIQSFNRYNKSRLLLEAVNGETTDTEEIIATIKAIKDVTISATPVIRMSELDVDEVIREEMGESSIIKSSMTLVNESMPWGGYLRGQVVQVVASPGCMTGDTRVPLLDGTVCTLEDLYKSERKNIGVYSCDELGNIKASVAESCQLSKHVDELIEIEIDDGTVLKTTLDHPMLLIDGTFCKAEDLTIGMSLMPMELKTKKAIEPWDRMIKIVEVARSKLESSVPVYDLVNVDIYKNYAVMLNDGSCVFSHNTGKTLFLLNEVVESLRNGLSVYMLSLGDMLKVDFITRISSIVTGIDYTEVSINPKKYFTDEVREIVKGLRITAIPAGQIGIGGVVDLINTYVVPEQEIDTFVLDYDANLERTNDSMYLEGGEAYDTLSAISRPAEKLNRLVFVASQPKVIYWNTVELPLDCANESSRKQAIVDMQIAMGRDTSIRHRTGGIFKINKSRRGKSNVKTCFVVSPNGNFQEISQGEFTKLKTFGDFDE